MDGLQQNTASYAILMLLAGIGIPIMATLNASLATKLQSSALAAAILFFVGFVGAVVYLLVSEGVPNSITRPSSTPFYFYLGGLFVLFYVLSITLVAPRFGIGNAIAFVLLGQLMSMATIDQFGLMGAQQSTLTLQRVFGLVFMAIGVFLVVRK
jgi:transporter family-2 protein